MNKYDNILLTLQKQHYLDQYDESLKAKITCLGYYDEIAIRPTETNSGILYQKKSNSPVSYFWHNTGDEIRKLSGGYSNQYIGLFRCKEADEDKILDEYWEEEGKLPFFAVGFLKLYQVSNYKEVIKCIEQRSTACSDEKICKMVTYCTFDNADLIVLMKSNSLCKMEEILQKIEGDENISYLHSIIGIDEVYLEACAENGKFKALKCWEGVRCWLEEEIARIDMKMVTDGSKQVLQVIKSEWEKLENSSLSGFDTLLYSYVTGHGNANFSIKNTNVEGLILLLQSNGFITHQNLAYENGLYNIETSVYMKEDNSWTTWNSKIVEKKTEQFKVFCQKKIEEYSKLFENKIQKDDSLFSCYQVLIQTLNTLDQYERFRISKDIFYLIIPSFRIFAKQLEDVLNNGKNLKEVKRTISKYLECVNSLIYHTVHTDQVYLMIPGYSGTSFSIPIKLNMLYLWFVEKVGSLLNDDRKEYGYILSPVMETKPLTGKMNLVENDDNCLICIKVSQRQLYAPRHMMIILTHEIAHYVGNDIRNRKLRMDCIMRTMAYYIAEGIFPEYYNGECVTAREEQLFECMKGIKRTLETKILEAMQRSIIDKQENTSGEYFADKIKDMLLNMCMEVISETQYGKEVLKLLRTVPDSIQQYSDINHYKDDIKYICRIQQSLDDNRCLLCKSEILDWLIQATIDVYQEVFSDVVALTLLECEQNDFYESFDVSEGYKHETTAKVEYRKWVFEQLNHTTANDKMYIKKRDNYGKIGKEFLDQYLCNDMYNFLPARELIKKYGEECSEAIKKIICEGKNKNDIGRIRHIYKMFLNNEHSCADIYSEICTCIEEYKQEVDNLENG